MWTSSFSSLRRAIGLTSVAAFAVVGLLIGSPSASAKACPAIKEVDYLSPLRGLPAIRQIPNDGHLAFSPRDLIVRAYPSLLAGGGRVGVSLASDRPKVSHRLNWTVELTVRRINGKGSPRGVIGRRTARLSERRSYWSDPLRLGVAAGRPGLYRSDLAIDRGRQADTSRFSQYVRVVPRTVDVQLRLDQPTFNGGDTVAARLQNRGSVGVAYGPGLLLDKWSGETWEAAEPDPHSVFPGYAHDLAPGAAGPCERFVLPAHLQPGRYRLVKTVGVGSKGRLVRAYFEVS